MIRILYFSPTGNTLRALQALAEALAAKWPQMPAQWIDYTAAAERGAMPAFDPEDVLIWGSPVYAGKLPNKLLPWLREHLKGCGNPAVLLCTFGNRGFDNALAEMGELAKAGGFRPVAAAALAAEHAFDEGIGRGRPSDADLAELRRWADRICLDDDGPLLLPGSAEAPYYQPLREDLQPALFLKAVPLFDADRCNGCGVCVERCPMGCLSVTEGGIASCNGVCIKCMACVRGCPQQAAAILHPDFVSHIAMLRQHCQVPRPNAFFC